jgi:hypothetical protein
MAMGQLQKIYILKFKFYHKIFREKKVDHNILAFLDFRIVKNNSKKEYKKSARKMN